MTEDEDPMDELDMLRSLSGQGPDPEPTAEVVDRHRHQVRAAIGSAVPTAIGGAERGDVDLREVATVDVEGDPRRILPARWRPARALAGIAAAAMLVAGIAAVQGGNGGPDETVSAGQPDGENSTGTGTSGGQPFACGDELPVEMLLPPGFEGPSRGPGGDAATVPAGDQLVMHWTGDNARIEVRWPAATDDDAANAGRRGWDQNGAAGDVLIGRGTSATPSPSGRVAQEMTAVLGDPPSEACQAFDLTVSAADEAAVQALLDQFMFAKDLPPLVSGSWTAERAPTVGRCQAPTGMATPPNRRAQLRPAVWYPDPATALQTFVDSQGSPGHPTGDARLSRLGYQEVTLPDGSIAYAYESAEGFFSTVIEVENSPEGWAVTGFEASGC